LAILMHEGAHRCFLRNGARDIALSQWLCAYAIFGDTLAYRRYHLAHHAHTRQENDPDLVLLARRAAKQVPRPCDAEKGQRPVHR
jgi:fatty acid desaturase